MTNTIFRNKINKTLVHTILILGVILTIVPFLWMIITSLKTMGEATSIPPTLLPKDPQWNHYREVQQTLPFPLFYFNTILYAVITCIGQVVICSMAAYSFGRIKFPGRDIIFIILLSILMVPGQVFLLPQYLIIQKLGLLNSIPALILPGLFSAFGTFLMRQFFMTLPKELEESAYLDGCNHFQIFWKIMLPLVKPGMVSLIIITALYCWNNLMWPLIVNTSVDKMTLAAGLESLVGQYTTNYPLVMAGAVLAILPMILIFIFLQKQFIQGIALTGSKG